MSNEEIIKEAKSKKLYTKSEFAKIIKKDLKTIERWINNGIIVTEFIKNKQFIRVANSLLNICFYYEDMAKGKDKNKEKETLQNELIEANIKFRNAATELQELKKDIQNEIYVSVEKVKQSNIKFLQLMKNHTISIPDRLMSLVSKYIPKDKERAILDSLKKHTYKLMTDFVERLELEQIEKGKIELNDRGNEKQKQGRKRKS